MDLLPISADVVSARDLERLGLDGQELMRHGFVSVERGLWISPAAGRRGPEVRIAIAVALAVHGVTLGGWAAARFHERRAAGRGDTVTVFDGTAIGADGRHTTEPLLVLAEPEARILARDDQRVFRSRVPDAEREPLGAAAITGPLRTAFDLARLSSPLWAVIALDRLLSLRIIESEALAGMLHERARWRGVGRARRALALAEDRVRSPLETVMRGEWLAAGLRRPLCNPDVCDSGGRLVAVPDLLDESSGLVGEYDGGYHASAEQRRADSLRIVRMTEVGLTVVRMTSADLVNAGRRSAWRRHLIEQHAIARSRTRRWSVSP